MEIILNWILDDETSSLSVGNSMENESQFLVRTSYMMYNMTSKTHFKQPEPITKGLNLSKLRKYDHKSKPGTATMKEAWWILWKIGNK